MNTDLQFTKPEARDAFAVAGHLIQCYLSSRAGLKQLGILRTERTLQGDFAEWLVAHLLDLQVSHNAVEKHIDASDGAGRTYQIKSRIVTSMSDSTSFDFHSSELVFDFLVSVFFDPSFNVLAVLRVPRDVVAALSHQTASTLRFRWSRACADDSRIERVFWRDPLPNIGANET